MILVVSLSWMLEVRHWMLDVGAESNFQSPTDYTKKLLSAQAGMALLEKGISDLPCNALASIIWL